MFSTWVIMMLPFFVLSAVLAESSVHIAALHGGGGVCGKKPQYAGFIFVPGLQVLRR